MGSFTFKWSVPTTDPSDVLVTGSFDGWTKSVTLEKEDGIFQKSVFFSEEDTTTKIYYKFVVDNTWVINEAYPHEVDHEGNVNNFLTADDLVRQAPEPASDLVTAPFINTVAPESTIVAEIAEMAKKNNTIKKNKAAAAAFAAEAAAAAAPAAEVGEDKGGVATPSDFPGGFPATPANEVADLEDKTVSVDPLPATAGLGNPIKLAPGEKIPDSITAQNIDQQVKLDKASYEKSDALPNALPLTADVPSVSGVVIPESSLSMDEKNDVNDVTINSVGPGSTTIALAGEVPLEPKQSAVPDVVKESQDKAGESPEASALPAKVEDKAKVEEEIKSSVPEAPATSVGTAGAGAEKEENTTSVFGAAAATGGAAVAAAVAVVAKLSGSVSPPVEKAKAATVDTIDSALPESVKSNLPAVVQDALTTETKESSVEEVSPHVPTTVKESIAEAGESPEAAVSTSAVADKGAVETELLKEVKEVPPVDATESAPAAETKATETASTAPEPAVPAEVKPAEETPVDVKPVEETPVDVKPVEETPVDVKPAETEPIDVKPVETKPVDIKAVDEAAEAAPVDAKPVEVEPVSDKPADTEAAPVAAITGNDIPAATTTTTVSAEPAAVINEDGNENSSETQAVESTAGDKKKNRFSVIFDKIKAKLK